MDILALPVAVMALMVACLAWRRAGWRGRPIIYEKMAKPTVEGGPPRDDAPGKGRLVVFSDEYEAERELFYKNEETLSALGLRRGPNRG